MDLVTFIESESVNIHLSIISIVLFVILALCIILCSKTYIQRKKQLLVCYVVMGISALSFSFFRENSLINIMASLYASCVFALLYSRLNEIEQEEELTKIKNNLSQFQEDLLEKVSKINDEMTNTLNKFQKEILEEVCKINNGLLYKHDDLYLSNEENSPNKKLFIKLADSLKYTKCYIYEGEDAATSSICLYSIRKHLIERNEKMNATFIFNSIPNDPESANKFFTSIFLLHNLYKEGCFKELKVVLRSGQTQQFVNLMDECLLFSPYPKSSGSRYPITYLYCKKENENSFYNLIKKVMNEILSEKTNKIITMNEKKDSLIGLKFDTFAEKGCFGNSIKCFKKKLMKFSNEEICKYFDVLITKRKELYKELIKIYDNE